MLKTEGFGAVLEVEMLKKCMPLWLEAHFEAHFEVKMYKAHSEVKIRDRTTFGS